MQIDTDALLDGMAGIAYLTDAEGTILGLGRQNWNAFACANNAAELKDGHNVLGRSFLDFVAGEEVRDSYRRCMHALSGDKLDFVRLLSRCDGPSVRRQLWITMRPVHVGGGIAGLLMQVLVISEAMRPPVDLFDFAAIRAQAALHPSRPILGMCSYCQNVRWPAGSSDDDGEWLAAEDYYRRGGDSGVRISHGLCPSCFDLTDQMLPH